MAILFESQKPEHETDSMSHRSSVTVSIGEERKGELRTMFLVALHPKLSAKSRYSYVHRKRPTWTAKKRQTQGS